MILTQISDALPPRLILMVSLISSIFPTDLKILSKTLDWTSDLSSDFWYNQKLFSFFSISTYNIYSMMILFNYKELYQFFYLKK